MDLLEDGQHGHGVDGRDEGAEHEAVQQGQRPRDPPHARAPPQRHADGHRVPQRVHERQQQDRAQVGEERADRHVVARVVDDGRQQEQEERVGVEDVLVRGRGVAVVQDGPRRDAQDDQDAALRDVGRESVVHVETCNTQWVHVK